MVWGFKQVESLGMCFFLFKVFHFTVSVMCCVHRAAARVSSTFLLSLAVNKKSVLRRGGTDQPSKIEHRDRLTGHKTNTICMLLRLWGGEMSFFSTVFYFLFFPSHQILHRHASKSAAPAATVSVESDHWQFLTIVFLRRAL